MEKIEKTRTEHILNAMRVLSWIVFIALLVETGAMLVSYGFCWFKPEAAQNFYLGLNLFELRQYDFWFFTGYVSLLVALSAMKAFVLLLVIKILSKVNLRSPFTLDVATILQTISYFLGSIWLLMQVGNGQTRWLSKQAGLSLQDWNGAEFLFVAGLVFIVSQIFKRGVEMQSENELTV